MSIEDVSLVLISAAGIIAGIAGFAAYKPGFNLHSYVASKFLMGSIILGAGSTVIIAVRYGLGRGIIHGALYCSLVSLGVVVYKKLDSKQQ